MEGEGAALRYASKVSRLDIVKLLVKKFSKKKDLKKNINHPDQKGLTSLHYACQNGCVDTTKYLLKNEGGKLWKVTVFDIQQ